MSKALWFKSDKVSPECIIFFAFDAKAYFSNSFANILFYFELYKCFNPKNTTNLQPYKNATVLQNHTHSNFQHFYNFTIYILFLLFLTQGRKIKFG